MLCSCSTAKYIKRKRRSSIGHRALSPTAIYVHRPSCVCVSVPLSVHDGSCVCVCVCSCARSPFRCQPMPSRRANVLVRLPFNSQFINVPHRWRSRVRHINAYAHTHTRTRHASDDDPVRRVSKHHTSYTERTASGIKCALVLSQPRIRLLWNLWKG